MNPTFDDRDSEILSERIALRELISGPRVGDFIFLGPDDLRRFTHKWNDGLQTTIKGNVDTSFHIHSDGSLDFSGSLAEGVTFDKIHEMVGDTLAGRVWFFHHGYVQAHNGVHVEIPCRVYRLITP